MSVASRTPSRIGTMIFDVITTSNSASRAETWFVAAAKSAAHIATREIRIRVAVPAFHGTGATAGQFWLSRTIYQRSLISSANAFKKQSAEEVFPAKSH